MSNNTSTPNLFDLGQTSVATASNSENKKQITSDNVSSHIFENELIETIKYRDAIFFKIADIVKILEIGHSTASKWFQREWFDADEIINVTKCHIGGKSRKYVAESGLYRILNRVNTQKAKPFERWVTKEVLPSIRKTGSYSIQQKVPKTYAEALLEAGRLALEVERQQAQLQAQQYKVEYAEAILSAENSQSVGDFAKMLCGKGVKIGQNRLFEWLREAKYLKDDNLPYQKYMDCGYFELLPQSYPKGNSNVTRYKVLITPKGQHHFTMLFIDNE